MFRLIVNVTPFPGWDHVTRTSPQTSWEAKTLEGISAPCSVEPITDELATLAGQAEVAAVTQ